MIGNETSGAAINSRTAQSETGNLHYADNLGKAIKELGTIIVNLIPKVYDTERVIRIIGVDDQQKIVTINNWLEYDSSPGTSNMVINGRYDVIVDTSRGMHQWPSEEKLKRFSASYLV